MVRNSLLAVALAVGLVLALVPTLVVAAGGGEPVGAEACGSCHPQALEAWRSGPHARAQSRLTEVQQRDKRCRRCHAPMADEGLSGVQCESCHGAGSYYVRDYVMRDAELARLVGLEDVSVATCQHCHEASAPSLTPFDFEAKSAAIRHWSPTE